MKLRTATFLTVLASPVGLADGWVVLDVRHATYDDRIRIVLDIDRNQKVTSTLHYQAMELGFPNELRRVDCQGQLPAQIDLSWDTSGLQLNWQGQWWGETFQLANPPRQVIDLHQRVGVERIKPLPQVQMRSRHCSD